MTPKEAVNQLVQVAPLLVDDANLIASACSHRRFHADPELMRRMLASIRRIADPDDPDAGDVSLDDAVAQIAREKEAEARREREFLDRHAAFRPAFAMLEMSLAGLADAKGVQIGTFRGASACEVLKNVAASIDAGLRLLDVRPGASDFEGLDWGDLRASVRAEVGQLFRLPALAPSLSRSSPHDWPAPSPQTPDHAAPRGMVRPCLIQALQRQPRKWLSSKDALKAAGAPPDDSHWETTLRRLAGAAVEGGMIERDENQQTRAVRYRFVPQ